MSTSPDRAVRGACPSCGFAVLDIPEDRPVRQPIPRAWRLVDRATVRAYVESLSDELTEWLLVLFVDERLQLLSVETLGKGAAGEVRVDIRRLITRALQIEAGGFLLVHNHPSGDARPSEADVRVTARLRAMASDLGIPLLDHLIIAGGDIHAVGWGKF